MSNKAKGVIKSIAPTQQVNDKFCKRNFVIETADQFPQTIEFQLSQDKCSLIDSFTEGQEVEIDFDLRGREWTGSDGVVKVFNTLEAWKITGENVPPIQEQPKDDLPF